MTGKGRSVSRCGPVHRQLAHTTTFWRWVAPRISNANAVAYFAWSLMRAPRASDLFLSKAGWFFVVQCPSMIIGRDGPRRRAACEKETDFPPLISINSSHLCRFDSPLRRLQPLSVMILRFAGGAQLHLEVKTALLWIKTTFLFPEPLGRGSISSKGSIWGVE